jgi:aryl-alcohol dehydrogenase-like predicted oxidoreductase
MRNERRRFMQTAAALAGGGLQAAGGIPRRPLGKTGLQVSILGLGGAPIGRLPEHGAAVELVRLCYDLGVNYFDTAAAGAYGLSQARYGAALKGVRDRVVLGTKTRHRTYTQAEIDLNQSLANLATDRIDLYQIHNVTNEEDIEFIFARRGVMELVEKAKQAGKIRFVGVTGHTGPKILNRIIEQYAFDTVLMPLSVADGANHAKSFEEQTAPLARRKGMGIIAMKTLGAGALLKQSVASVEEALRYVWTLPVSTAILGCSTAEQIRADARLAQTAKPLSASSLDELRRRAAPLASALEPWKAAAGDKPVYRAD